MITEDWSTVMLKKKKTIQSLAKIEEDHRLGLAEVPPDMYGQKEARERLSLTKSVIANLRKKELTDLVFDSQANLLEKKSE